MRPSWTQFNEKISARTSDRGSGTQQVRRKDLCRTRHLYLITRRYPAEPWNMTLRGLETAPQMQKRRRPDGLPANHHCGRTIFLGSIDSSNSSAVTNPKRIASSRNVVPLACAVLAIRAALS